MYPKSSTSIIGGICAFAGGTLAAATPYVNVLDHPPPGIKYTRPVPPSSNEASTRCRPPWTKTSHIPQTQNVQRIQGIGGAASKTNSRSVAALLGAHQRQVGGVGYENITVTNAYGTSYACQVLWDGFPMYLIVDTGSSDTWAIRHDFSCIDYTGEILPQDMCGFGPADPNPVSRYDPITPPQHMYVSYADGEQITGPMGYSDITVGNITVQKQQACLANTTYWFGNNFTSGLLGLAYPSITNAYVGSAIGSDPNDPKNRVEYSPFFTSMITQGLVAAPLFSMAIDRNASTGVLAWGGIPAAVSGLDTSRSVTLDLIVVSVCVIEYKSSLKKYILIPPLPLRVCVQASLVDRAVTAYEYSFYTVIVDGWQFGQTTNTVKQPYIIDSGTTLCYLPPGIY